MCDKHNTQFCADYLKLLDLLNDHDRVEIEVMINEMLMNAIAKFKKDFYDILEYPADIDNVTIVPSIQRVESTFSTLRRVENIDNLSKQKVFSETMFRQNKTMEWVLQEQNYEEIIAEATTSKNRLSTLKNDKIEDMDMDRTLYHRRLVLEPQLKKRRKITDQYS